MIWLLCLFSNYSVYELAPDGSSVEPMEETEVRLASELVEAKVLEERLMGFRARFVLENPTKEKIKLTVGFPFSNEWFDLAAAEPEPAAPRLSYRAYLDGKEIPAELSEDPGSGTAVYLSEIEIGPGEKKELLCTYTLAWSQEAELLRFSYTLGYIATTGAAWAGKLDSAVFRFQIPPEFPRPGLWNWLAVYPWDIRPAGYVFEDGWVTWKFKDWEPSEDFRISVMGLDWSGLAGQFPMDMLDGIAVEFAQNPKKYELSWPSGAPCPRKSRLLFLAAILEKRQGREPADTMLARVLSDYHPDTTTFPFTKNETKALEYLNDEIARIEKTEMALKEKGFWDLAPLFLFPWYYESGDITYYIRYGEEIPEDMLVRFKGQKGRNYLRVTEALLLVKKGTTPKDRDVRLFLEYIVAIPMDESWGGHGRIHGNR